MVADGDAEQSYSSANTNNLVEQPKMNFDEVFENPSHLTRFNKSFVNVLNREELYCETLSLTTLNPGTHDWRRVPSFSV